jgi:hypothetical protein
MLQSDAHTLSPMCSSPCLLLHHLSVPYETCVCANAHPPTVFPTAKCRLRVLKLERIKDYLLLEEEYIKNQEVFKPREEKDQEERAKVGTFLLRTLEFQLCFRAVAKHVSGADRVPTTSAALGRFECALHCKAY